MYSVSQWTALKRGVKLASQGLRLVLTGERIEEGGELLSFSTQPLPHSHCTGCTTLPVIHTHTTYCSLCPTSLTALCGRGPCVVRGYLPGGEECSS